MQTHKSNFFKVIFP